MSLTADPPVQPATTQPGPPLLIALNRRPDERGSLDLRTVARQLHGVSAWRAEQERLVQNHGADPETAGNVAWALLAVLPALKRGLLQQASPGSPHALLQGLLHSDAPVLPMNAADLQDLPDTHWKHACQLLAAARISEDGLAPRVPEPLLLSGLRQLEMMRLIGSVRADHLQRLHPALIHGPEGARLLAWRSGPRVARQARQTDAETASLMLAELLRRTHSRTSRQLLKQFTH